MRTLGLVGVLCLACSRTNPAFDEAATEAGEGTKGPDTTGTVALDTGDTTAAGTTLVDTTAPGTTAPELETSATSDTASPDLPIEPVCMHSPTPGLDIQAGDPASFGGVCPSGIFIWTTLVSSDGSGVRLDTCDENCSSCSGETHPVSMFPLDIADHVPMDRCLMLEVTGLVLEEEGTCHFNALTIHEPEIMEPHVIAISHAATPTTAGLALLDDAIPMPMAGDDCACDEVDQATECCETAPSPPTFYFYPVGGEELYAGGDAPVALGLPGGLAHTFRVLQAQDIPTCENQGLQLSWAVLATP